MMGRYLLLVSFMVAILACNNNEKGSVGSKKIFNFQLDTIKFIRFPGEKITKRKLFTIKDSAYISWFLEGRNSIALSKNNNADHIEQIKFINLPEDSKIEEILTFQIQNKDSIFLFGHNGIELIDSAGIIKDSFYFSIPAMVEEERLMLFSAYGKYDDVYYNHDRKWIFSPSYGMTFPLSDLNAFNVSLGVKIDWEKQQVEKCAISYPANYLKNNYGELFRFYNTYNLNEGIIVYSFNASDSLFCYNDNSKTVAKYKVRSKYQSSPILPFNIENWNDMNLRLFHMTVNTSYENIIYDKYRNLYYRMLKLGVPEKTDDKFNNYFDKPVVIMVLDSKFGTIKEIELGSNVAPAYSFVTEKGLFIRFQKDKSKLYEEYYLLEPTID